MSIEAALLGLLALGVLGGVLIGFLLAAIIYGDSDGDS